MNSVYRTNRFNLKEAPNHVSLILNSVTSAELVLPNFDERTTEQIISVN
jgi:hypothetical protein